MKRAKWAKLAGIPQLGAVVLALVIVLGAGGYGITRGLTAKHNCATSVDRFNILQREISPVIPHEPGTSGEVVTASGAPPIVTIWCGDD